MRPMPLACPRPDPCTERRTEDRLLARLLADPSTRVLILRADAVPYTADAVPRLVLLAPDDVPARYRDLVRDPQAPTTPADSGDAADPGASDRPEGSGGPDAPGTSEGPGGSDVSDRADRPAASGASALPDVSGASALPDVSGASALPDVSGASALPAASGASGLLDVSGASGLPDLSGIPEAPGRSEVSDAEEAASSDAEPDAVWIYLGRAEETEYVALATFARPPSDIGPDAVTDPQDGPRPGEVDVPGATWGTIRDLGGVFDQRDVGLAVEALCVAGWHRVFRHCPRCGAPTKVVHAGWVRRCTAEGVEHYPRIDPAVIVAVTDDADRLLLAHAAAWTHTERYSLPAGYVEPGESLEQAVCREVAEEIGLVVDDVRYAGDQPWPPSGSLMVGFTARAVTTDIGIDGREITDARWFTRRELDAAVADGIVALPPASAIARTLIDAYRAGV